MMLFFGICIGFVAAFICHALFANIAFFALAVLYATGLYLLFYGRINLWQWPFYLGITLANELLSSSRFGLYTLFAYTTFILILVFKERLRFTSLEIRFSIALAIQLISYGLISSSLEISIGYALSLISVFILFTGIAVLRPTLSNDELFYE